jgi:hypothetical protein
MNMHRILSAKDGKKLLISCAVVMVIVCSIVFLPGSHALAATSPHVSKTPSLKGSHSPFVANIPQTIWPALNFNGCGTGWNNVTDLVYSFAYAYTTGRQACSSAVWDNSSHTLGHNCFMNVYIPQILATANIAYGIVDANGTERVVINQNDVSGWQPLGHVYPSIRYVYISSNNGQTGTYMAAGPMTFACVS